MCRGVPVGCGRVVEIGYSRGGKLGAAADRLWRELRSAGGAFPVTLLGDARLLETGRHPGPAPVDRERRGPWRSPWVWLGVSGAVIAVAAGLLLSQGGELEPVFTGDRCGFGGC
jgi:hypothetical protein